MGITRYKISSNFSLNLNKTDEAYLDTSFLIFCSINSSLTSPADRPRFRLAKHLLQQLLKNKTSAIISTLVLDETWYIYLKLLYQKDNGSGSWAPTILKDHPEIIAHYKAELEELQKKILKFPNSRIIGVSADSAEFAFQNMINFNLAPRDSFHIAVCYEEGLQCFITADRDFKSIPRDWKEAEIKLITL